MDPVELVDDILYQIGALEALARAAGVTVRYVKAARGALQRGRGAREPGPGRGGRGPHLRPRLAPRGTARLGAAGHRRAGRAPHDPRGVADWAYTPQGTLVPRREAGAVLSDPAEVARRVVQMVVDGHVDAIDGSRVTVHAESVCVHGDSQERWRWRSGSAPTWPPRAWSWGRSCDGADRAGLRRPRAPRRARRHRAGRRLGGRPATGRGTRRRRPGARRRDRARRRAGGRGRPAPARHAGRVSCPRRPARCRPAATSWRSRSATTAPTWPTSPGSPASARARWSRRTAARSGGSPSAGSPRASPTSSATDDRLHVPRRDSARTAVPAGQSPWPATTAGSTRASHPAAGSLIGTTNLQMWHLDRDPPALLRPRAAMQYVQAAGS